MVLTKIKINNFRNYDDQEAEFNPAGAVFYGNNAQGKTNMLDALYYLSFLRCRRNASDEDLIKFEKDGFYLCGEVLRKKEFLQKVEVSYSKPGEKKLKINSKFRSKFPSPEEGLKIVAFYPDDFLLVNSTPLVRRRFLNLEISQVDASYRLWLKQYQEVISNRNTALRRIRDKKATVKELDIWDEQLIDYGSKIINKRIAFIEDIYYISYIIHSSLTNKKENLGMEYVSSSGNNILPVDKSVDRVSFKIADTFRSCLLSARNKEIAFGMTLLGPHRDDLRFLINKANASVFSSHAQARTIAISLRLALVEFLDKFFEEPPVVLLDDVLSELDEKRRETLLSFLAQKKVQCFITGTNKQQFEGLLNDIEYFEVEAGAIKKQLTS